MFRKYGFLYSRAKVTNADECLYCGEHRQCLDHVPPLSQLDYIDTKEYAKKGGTFLLYPSCLSCNGALWNKMSIDIQDRMLLLAQHYEKKGKKATVWTEVEKADMGKNMLSFIESATNKADVYLQKSKKIYARMAELPELTNL